MLRDISTACLAVAALSPVSVANNTAQVGEIIDLQGFQGCLFVPTAGSLADADATFTVLIEEGDAANLSDAAAVADDDLVGTEAAASFVSTEDDTVKQVGYVGTKRYVRMTITPANNTGAALLSGVAILRPEMIGTT